MGKFTTTCFMAAVLAAAAGTASAATLKASAAASLEFEATSINGNDSGIGFDPTLGLYYGGQAGNPGNNGTTWDETGATIDTATSGIDIRGVWYNPNTGTIETNTYNSSTGSGGYGLVTVNRTAAGDWAGSGTTQTAISGIASSQSVADYDAGRDVIYSRASGSTVNVARHSDGTLQGTITLSGLAAGTQSYTLGYVNSLDALVTFDAVNDLAQVFDMTGSLLGSVSLLGLTSPASSFGMAYENGFLFVRDFADNTWKGFDITDGDDDPVSAVPLPASLPLLAFGALALAAPRRRRG